MLLSLLLSMGQFYQTLQYMSYRISTFMFVLYVFLFFIEGLLPSWLSCLFWIMLDIIIHIWFSFLYVVLWIVSSRDGSGINPVKLENLEWLLEALALLQCSKYVIIYQQVHVRLYLLIFERCWLAICFNHSLLQGLSVYITCHLFFFRFLFLVR